MKVLFISSGNSESGISPIVLNQGESILNLGIEVSYFTIKGKGLLGYLKNISKIRELIKNNKFDIVHAHYSLSPFVATLSGAKPLIVSLMGSDVKAKSYYKILIKIFNKLFWKNIIVKSEDMEISLGIDNVKIIPNGVDLNIFKPLDQNDCKKQLGWDTSKKQILFAASLHRYEKNYKLAKEAFMLLNNPLVELKSLESVPNSMMHIYHNAADVVVLTSLWEGSPNVIKEAMACNRTIVATDVGDIKWLFGSTNGCFLSNFDSINMAKLLNKAITNKEIESRNRIKELELDSINISYKIIDLYSSSSFLR